MCGGGRKATITDRLRGARHHRRGLRGRTVNPNKLGVDAKMKYAKLLGAVLVAAFAISAITAATAAAAPEFRKLNPTTLSKEPVSSTTFTGTSGQGTLTGDGEVILCTGGSSKGNVNSSTTVSQVLVLYSGCLDDLSKSECHSSNEANKSGIILTNELNGKLGSLSSGLAGLLLAPESGSEFVKIASQDCSSTGIAVKGSIIGEILPGPGHLVLTGELNYESTGSSQNIQGWGGTALHELLTAFGTLLSGLEDKNSIKFGEEIEVS